MQNESARLDKFLAEYSAEKGFSGAVRITLRDAVIYERYIGLSSFENDIPFSKDSMFSFYSLSKPFCAIGLLKLYDRGLVDLDAHPSKYIPEAEKIDPRVTLRLIINHLSGIPDFELSKEFTDSTETCKKDIREQLKLLSELPMVFEPGTRGMYANVNFVICAITIENVSGLAYEEYMQKEVFNPIEMKSATIDYEGKSIVNRVQGYERADGVIRPVNRATLWMKGAGDIVGTLDDVYRLNHAIKYRLLLKPETWEMALTPSRLNHMGFGCTITDWYGKRRITHNGGHTGFRTLHVQLPEYDFDLIILSNYGFGNARNEISEEIHNIYFGESALPKVEVAMDTGYAKP